MISAEDTPKTSFSTMNQLQFPCSARDLAVSMNVILASLAILRAATTSAFVRAVVLRRQCRASLWDGGPRSETSVAVGRERRGRLTRAKREGPGGFVCRWGLPSTVLLYY